MQASHEPMLANPNSVSASRGFSSMASDRRLRTAILVCLTLLAAWLRLWHLGSKSLWLDEAATVALARLPWTRFVHEWWYGAASFQTTFLLLLRGWLKLAPPSEMWVRLPSALCGIISIPLLYALAHKLLGSVEVALASAALLAVNPTHVYYSQETRSYTFTIFLLLLSAVFLVHAVERDSNRDWALWTLFGTLAVYAHYFAALVMVALAVSLLFCRRPAVWAKFLFCGLIILAASLPGMSYVFRAPEFSSFSWMPRTSPRGVLHAAMFLGGSGIKFVIVAILWVAGTVSIVRVQAREPLSLRRWRGMAVLMWAIWPVALLALASLRHPMFVYRYLIFALPATVMLAAEGMEAFPKRRLGRALVTGLCILSVPTVFKDYHKPREDWRGAAAAVLASAGSGDAVVFVPEFTRVAFDYYAERSPRGGSELRFFSPPYYGLGKTAQDLQQELVSSPRQFPHVWVLEIREFGEDEAMPESGTALESQLRHLFGSPTEQRFQAITVLRFGP
jgi:mannosyltransferase